MPWGHNLLLIEKVKDKDIRKIYTENTIKNGWSRNVLSIQIETEFHKRIGNSNNNFNAMLPPKDSDLVNNTIQHILGILDLRNVFSWFGIWYFDLKSIIDLLIFIGTVIVLYVNPKNTIYSLVISIILAFMIRVVL